MGIVHDKSRRAVITYFDGMYFVFKSQPRCWHVYSDEPARYTDAEKCTLIGNRRSALWANDSLEHKRYNEEGRRTSWTSTGQQANRELNDHDTSPRQLIFYRRSLPSLGIPYLTVVSPLFLGRLKQAALVRRQAGGLVELPHRCGTKQHSGRYTTRTAEASVDHT